MEISYNCMYVAIGLSLLLDGGRSKTFLLNACELFQIILLKFSDKCVYIAFGLSLLVAMRQVNISTTRISLISLFC